VLAAVSALMTASLLAASLSVFPYLERFKSPRFFSAEVKRIVSPQTPLFIYADTMNDFNFYLERETIPILPSPAAVDALLAKGQHGYILVKERDLKRVASWSRNRIVLTAENGGSAIWHLLEFNSRSAE
jgi:hypothetical protein